MIALKILSSKTKLDILELLSKRRYTITELSKHLNKSKSTISEHLTFLYNNGFVDKENNHKWTYYYISEKGKSFLEHIKALKMTFGTGISAVGVYVVYRYIKYTKFLASKSAKVDVMEKSYMLCDANNMGTPDETIIQASNMHLSIIKHINDLFTILILLIVIYIIYLLLIKRFGANQTI